MDENYVIVTETCYVHKQTKKWSSNHQTLITKKEEDYDVPLIFSSVEKAREYLEAQGLHEIAFLNYRTSYDEVKDAPYFYKVTKYNIKSVIVN